MTTTPPRTEVPIRSAAELTDHWTALLDPPIFGTRSLWLMWLQDDGRPLELIIPLEDLPQLPENAMLAGLLSLHEAVSDTRLDGGGHLAMVLCRPGRPEITEDDDAWVDGLSEVLDDHIDAGWSLHLAAGGHVQPLVDLRS
jgi:hypothetical protein